MLEDIRTGEISARVVNIPNALIADADGHVPHETIMATNEYLADMVVRFPGKIHGLASVDAYDGEKRPGRPSARSAILDCAVSLSIAHAATC